MNRIRQHIPGYFDPTVFEPAQGEFETLDELMALEFVKLWTEAPGFYRFCKSSIHLIAELDKGGSWWVVGFFTDPAAVDLPEWSYKESLAQKQANEASPIPPKDPQA